MPARLTGATLGVAPEAEIVDVKMVQCGTLRGTIKGIVDGAHWVIEDHARRGGPAIANWSFIADTAADIPALDSAVTALRNAGIAVVVSAGNVDLNACRISPANAWARPRSRWIHRRASAAPSMLAPTRPRGAHASTCSRRVIPSSCQASIRRTVRSVNSGTARRCRRATSAEPPPSSSK